MKITVIKSTEYKYNQSSVFAIVNNQYVGCLIYPHIRNYPTIEYWQSATSSDSNRGFILVEKEFSQDEISNIESLQLVINNISKLIPNQPYIAFNYPNFKIKKGANYQAWLNKENENKAIIDQWFADTKIFDSALTKAKSDLRNILNK
jgi:hypothetical protein